MKLGDIKDSPEAVDIEVVGLFPDGDGSYVALVREERLALVRVDASFADDVRVNGAGGLVLRTTT